MLIAIHQPNSKIFSLMDHVILMRKGEIMYQCDADKMSEHFEQHGFAVPQGYNVQEWALEVSQTVSRNILEDRGFFGKFKAFSKKCEPENETSIMSDRVYRSQRISIVNEMKELCTRDLISFKRDQTIIAFRYGTISLLSALTAYSFWGVGLGTENPQGFASHVGLVYHVIFSCVIISNFSVTEAVKEREVFVREYSRRYYRILPYIITKVCNDFCVIFFSALLYIFITYWSLQLQGSFWYWFSVIFVYGLGCHAVGYFLASLPEDASHANLYIPLVVTPQLLFSGFFVTYDMLPLSARWISWLQPLSYAFRLLLREEFSSCVDLSVRDQHAINCAKAIESKGNVYRKYGYAGIYNDDSILTLMQGGQYKGIQNILEYFQFFSGQENEASLLWNFCEVCFCM